MNQSLAEPVPQARLVKRRVAANHGGCDAFAALGVGQSADRAFFHSGALAQHSLDYLRIDVVAAGDDQVVLSADERQETGGVTTAQIAGVEPAVAECGSRLRRIVPIFAEKIRPANAHRTDFCGCCRPAMVANDLHLDTGKWQAN